MEERLKQRILMAKKALAAFEAILEQRLDDDVNRDAAIQRFQFTFEAVWKAVQSHLRINEGLEVGTPKGVIRASHQAGLLEEPETEDLLMLVDDRNLTVHTYNEDLAVSLAKRLHGHAALLHRWLGMLPDAAPSTG